MESNATIEDMLEPVYYCKSCHSLHILVDETMANEDWDGSYCGKCNSADIGECTMAEWLEEEERRKRSKRDREWRR